MKQEIWKEIPGFDKYLLSENGNVKSFKYKQPRILKPFDDGKGYLKVKLRKEGVSKNFSIHKLVAIVFLKHIPQGHKEVVDHIDNDKRNNHFSNLNLITQRENASKDRKNGSSKYIGVCLDKRRGNWFSQIRIKNKHKFLGYFNSEEEASFAYQNALKQIE